MMTSEQAIEILAIMLKKRHGIDNPEEEMKDYLEAFNHGWEWALQTASNRIKGWYTNMDDLHEGVTKGLLSEVDHDVRGLEYGDE